MRSIQLLPFSLAIFILTVSCNGKSEKSANNSSPSDSTQATASTETNASSGKETINVIITGGDMNGTYSATCKEGCCSWGIAGENVFGNQYSETGKGSKELSSVQLIVDDVKQGSTSTKEFTLTVSFGELLSKDSKSFNINTRKGNKKGSGTLDLQYSGNKATVTIKGVSAEGPSVDLTMQCSNVMSPTNMGQ